MLALSQAQAQGAAARHELRVQRPVHQHQVALLAVHPVEHRVRRGGAVLQRQVLQDEHVLFDAPQPGGRVQWPLDDERAGQALEKLTGDRTVHMRVIPMGSGSAGWDVKLVDPRVARRDRQERIVDRRVDVQSVGMEIGRLRRPIGEREPNPFAFAHANGRSRETPVIRAQPRAEIADGAARPIGDEAADRKAGFRTVQCQERRFR